MASSQYLKDLKTVWGDSCHAMWVELLCIAVAHSHVIANYASIPPNVSLQEQFYAPELTKRISNLTRDVFLEKSPSYRHAVVTNRIVILSASFEAYFSSFLDAYIANRAKFYDAVAGKRNAAGDKLYGDVRKARGPVKRIEVFAELTSSGIKTIEPLLSYLNDVYTLRNVFAHQAGLVDKLASTSLVNLQIAAGERLVLSPDKLIELAATVMKIADFLDDKIISEYDNTKGGHRPEVIAERARRRPPKVRPSRRSKD